MRHIIADNRNFILSTKNTSYMFRVTSFGHLEHVHYGIKAEAKDIDALALKRTIAYGDSTMYSKDDSTYCMDVLPQEYSSTGRGDYREPAIEIECGNHSTTTDFIYRSHEIIEGDTKIEGLPNAYGADETLIITLEDEIAGLQMKMHYGLFYDCDVISRRIELKNVHRNSATIRKIMSMSVDINEGRLQMMSFAGGWANEVRPKLQEIIHGRYVVESRTGFSSSKTNPGFLIKKTLTNETSGYAWGFNLIYSGSHYSSISRDDKGNMRIMTGINGEDFSWELKKGETFSTPAAVMTFSSEGLNDMSHHFHDFINNHIVRSSWKNRERPILVNDWEAYMFDFSKSKLVSLAKEAAKLGFEMFVLDDGWFGKRNSDKAGLGDYNVNTKKLPGGLKALSNEVHKLGLKFGLWFEPEAVNPDSDLYREHPEWAISEKDRPQVCGRNELLLDLTNRKVRDYIVKNVSRTLDDNNVDYIKWDMNRQMAYSGGDYSHRYIIGLYEVLERIFAKRPDILFESCSSGGNRFDLGMLCYSPQIWSSDDTDAIERLRMQKSYSYLYPLSCMGAHVSAVPNAQTLRTTPLHTRFNVAAFGAFGYELDLTSLTALEKKEVKKQLQFYKENRRLFQYGRFYRHDLDSENRETFEVADGEKAIICKYRRYCEVMPEYEKLESIGLKEDGRYRICSRPYVLNIKQFGNLINFVTPVKVNADGVVVHEIGKHIGMEVPSEEYDASLAALKQGLPLDLTFIGTGYNERIKLPTDYGSEMYIIEKQENDEHPES